MIRENYFFNALLAWSKGQRSMWPFLSGCYMDCDDNTGTAPWDQELRIIRARKHLQRMSNTSNDSI
jgi:hypothetical protein